ncbi:hypothetical protein V6N11_006119 [Hibiscus sabdariffa]|uniref:Uncharacterized protein n=1 Tax=Hibiscus sabdariffa TaxID=183260 RepID=A0ABR2RQ51_9ROSI
MSREGVRQKEARSNVEAVKGKGLSEVDLVLSGSCFNEVIQDRSAHLKNLFDSPHSLEVGLALNVHSSFVNIVGANCLVDPLSCTNHTTAELCFGGLVSVIGDGVECRERLVRNREGDAGDKLRALEEERLLRMDSVKWFRVLIRRGYYLFQLLLLKTLKKKGISGTGFLK